MVLGVDFDNTIVNYDTLILKVAMNRQLVSGNIEGGKKSLRDAIRTLPNGEIEWQKIQALVYGPRMMESTPAIGIVDFLSCCSKNGIDILIVSHKTEFAAYDETNTRLPGMARKWIGKHLSIVDRGDAPLEGNVFFEPTRSEKIQRIKDLHCTHFIDDLEETFLEESFPQGITKILYSPSPNPSPPPGVSFAGNWQQISNYLFYDIN